MPVPTDDVSLFLENTNDIEGRDLEVAIVYAESMVEALKTSGEEWEEAVVRLKHLKRSRLPGDCN